MTRVSSFGHNQNMVNQLLTNQSRLYETQTQINTGKKATTFSGFARDAQTLLGAKSLMARNTSYVANLQDVKQKLDTNNLYLENIYKAAGDLKQAIVGTLGQREGVSFAEDLKQAAGSILSALNAQMDGRYIFAGSRSDTKPVSADTLDDLVAAPNVASLMQNDTIKLSTRVGDNMEISHGLLASDVGQSLLTSLKAIADFNAGGAGPIDGKLTAAQTSFLEGEMANITSAIGTVQSSIAENGSRQNRVDGLKDDMDVANDFLTTFIGDIEDVNMTEAVTRFNADQLSLETSYKVVGQLLKLSLANFL